MSGGRVWVLFGGIVLCMETIAAAIEKGDVVIVAQQAELRVPSGKVGEAAPGDYLIVEEIKDKWLWVKPNERGQAGWIDSARVVPHPEAMEHFSRRIEKNKQDAAAFAGRAAMLQASFEWDRAERDSNECLHRKILQKEPLSIHERHTAILYRPGHSAAQAGAPSFAATSPPLADTVSSP